MNASIISLAVLAVVAALVAGFFLLRRKAEPPLTEAQEALIEQALSEHLAPGQSITFGGANAERLQAEYNKRRAEQDEIEADIRGLNQTMEEFLGSTNFEQFLPGVWRRKPDPTDESLVSGSEYTSGGNTRHDALKAAQADEALLREVDGLQAKLDDAYAAILRNISPSDCNVEGLHEHERVAMLHVLTKIVDAEPLMGIAQLFNVEGWRHALAPQDAQPTMACGLDSCAGCGTCAQGLADVATTHQADAWMAVCRALDEALGQEWIDGPECARECAVAAIKSLAAKANATQSQAQQTNTEGPSDIRIVGLPVREMGEEPAQEPAREALNVCPCSFCRSEREQQAAIHEALWGAVLEGVQSTPLAQMLKRLDEDRAQFKSKQMPPQDGSAIVHVTSKAGEVFTRTLNSAPAETSSTPAREANGIASSYPVAENAGLTSDQIDFGIERRYPFVSRFGRHDGRFDGPGSEQDGRYKPAADEGSQP